MNNSKIFKIIRALHNRTISKEIEWEETGSGEDFQTSFSGVSLRVGHNPFDGSCNLQVYNGNGYLVEAIDQNEIQLEGFENEATLIGEVYNMAKRQAYGVDEVLDELLEELENVHKEDKMPF
jgi:hypothetical protein